MVATAFDLFASLAVGATVVLALAWGATSVLRRSSATTRHAVWASSCVALAVLPVCLVLLPPVEVAVWPAPAVDTVEAGSGTTKLAAPAGKPRPVPTEEKKEESKLVAPTLVAPTAAKGIPSARGSVPTADAVSARQATKLVAQQTAATGASGGSFVTARQAVVLVWLIGAGVLVLRLLAGLGSLLRLRRRTAADATVQAVVDHLSAAMGIRRRVDLLVSDRASGPMTFGVLRPVVVLPAEQSWSVAKLRCVLVHELAHVRRLDWPLQLLSQLVVAAFWWHPLAWLQRRSLHVEQERACDDAVVAQGELASDYALYLTEIAGALGRRSAQAAAAAPWRSELMARMTYLLDGNQRRRSGRLLRFGLPGLVMLSTMATGSVSLTAEQAVAQPSPQEPARIAMQQGKKGALKQKKERQQQPTPQAQEAERQKQIAHARRLVSILDIESHRRLTQQELSRLGERAMPALRAGLRDRRESIVVAVVEVLGRMRRQQVQVTPLLIRTMDDKRLAVALGAIESLGQLDRVNSVRLGGKKLRFPRWPTADARDAARRAVEALRRAVHGSREETVTAAIKWLGKVRSYRQENARLLARWVADPTKRRSALVTLLAMKDQLPKVLENLFVHLDSDDPELVCAVIDVLAWRDGRIRDAATAKVRPLLRSKNKDVVAAAQRYLRRTAFTVLIADYSDNQVSLVNRAGKELFKIEEVFGVWDVESLRGGNLLLTEFSVNRVVEYDREKKVVWYFDDLKNPYDADRLANGNTLIADTYNHRVIEVNKAGKIVWKYDQNGVQPYDVERLANGNTLIVDAAGDQILEVNRLGQTVWRMAGAAFVNCLDADRLPNGTTMLTIRLANRVCAIDRAGKVVWQIDGLNSPSDADRLPNGDIMVAESGMVRVFRRQKDGKFKEVWRRQCTWAVEANVGR